MKNLAKYGLFIALCGVFVACDDSGTSASDESNSTSEQVTESSSSEVIPSSSSSSHSELVSESNSSSSEDVLSSSSSEAVLSSSQNQQSSSSVDPEGPQGDMSSSRVESSSSSMKAAWDYLNPNISYGEMTDSRDGQTYKTVTIGSQTWMAENLNYAYNEKTSSLDSSSFCYNNEPDSCAKYGRLYLWSAAMDSAAVFSDAGKGCGFDTLCNVSGTVSGVCPKGWHLPDTTEWKTLFTSVGWVDSAGTKLKSTSEWFDGGDGEDSYGFSVLPAGFYFSEGDFGGVGYYTHFWNSTEYGRYDANIWNFHYGQVFVMRDFNLKNIAYSVRCLKD